MKKKSNLKKYQPGGQADDQYEFSLEHRLVPRGKKSGGFLTGRNKPTKEKSKQTSNDGMYVTKNVSKTYDGPNVYGDKTKTKSRRTVTGVLQGAKPGTSTRTKDIVKTNKRTAIAPGPNFYKKGGSTKKK